MIDAALRQRKHDHVAPPLPTIPVYPFPVAAALLAGESADFTFRCRHLDAAHMMLTVRELVRQGLSDFSMVHDSYAVHACDVDLMQRVLREQFARLHTEFTLEGFLKQVKAQAPGLKLTKSHPLPPLGTLDLSQVFGADYFFS